MAKLRITESFGVTPNEVLNNVNLTFKAKGLFGFIQSKPDGWDFSAERIATQTKDGVKAVYAGLKELEEQGYLVRKQYKLPNGKWDWEYVLTSSPFSVSTKTVDAFSVSTKPADISNKDIVKKSSKKDTAVAEATPVGQLPKGAGGTPLARVAKAYKRLYKSTFGIEPKVYLNGKDGAVLKSLLKDYSEYQVAAILLEYFDVSDYKVKDAAYPITWVSPRVNQLIVSLDKEIDFTDPVQVKKTVDESFKSL